MGGALRALAAGPPLLFARLHPFLPKLSAPAVIPFERVRVCSGLGYGNVRDSCAGRRCVRRGTAPPRQPTVLKALQPVDLTTTRTPSLYHDERVRMQQREPPRLRVRPSPPLPLVRRQAQPAHPTERAGQRERTASGTASAARSRVGPNVSGRSRTRVVPLPACNTDGVGMSCNRDKAAARAGSGCCAPRARPRSAFPTSLLHFRARSRQGHVRALAPSLAGDFAQGQRHRWRSLSSMARSRFGYA